MRNQTPNAAPSPFVGPMPIRSGALYGREREVQQLKQRVLVDKLVVLYSPSGAGKTSLIQAGLRPAVRELFNLLPIARVATPVKTAAGVNPVVASVAASLTILGAEWDGSLRAAVRAAHADMLATTGDKRRPALLIIDQFEELLTAQTIDDAARNAFLKELAALVNDEEEPLWLLVSMREEYFASLDQYRSAAPELFESTFRIAPLDPAAAERVIKKTVESAAGTIEDKAVQRIVEQLRSAQNMAAARRGDAIVERAAVSDAPKLARYVEPLLLQIVCKVIWEDAVARRPNAPVAIRLAEIPADGSLTDRALVDFVHGAFARVCDSETEEGLLRDWVEESLLDGAIRRQSLAPQRPDDHVDEETVQALCDAYLVRSELRGDTTWYELAHDALVQPLQRSTERWRREHGQVWKTNALHWDKAGGDEYLRVSKSERAAIRAADPATFTPHQLRFVNGYREFRRRWVRRVVAGLALALLAGASGAYIAGQRLIEARQERDRSDQNRMLIGALNTLSGDVTATPLDKLASAVQGALVADRAQHIQPPVDFSPFLGRALTDLGTIREVVRYGKDERDIARKALVPLGLASDGAHYFAEIGDKRRAILRWEPATVFTETEVFATAAGIGAAALHSSGALFVLTLDHQILAVRLTAAKADSAAPAAQIDSCRNTNPRRFMSIVALRTHVLASVEDCGTTIWRIVPDAAGAPTLREPRVLGQGRSMAALARLDGERAVMTALRTEPTLEIWHIVPGVPVETLALKMPRIDGRRPNLWRAAVSADGASIAAAGPRGDVFFWRDWLKNPEPQIVCCRSENVRRQSVTALALAKEGLSTAGLDGRVRRWDWDGGRAASAPRDLADLGRQVSGLVDDGSGGADESTVLVTTDNGAIVRVGISPLRGTGVVLARVEGCPGYECVRSAVAQSADEAVLLGKDALYLLSRRPDGLHAPARKLAVPVEFRDAVAMARGAQSDRLWVAETHGRIWSYRWPLGATKPQPLEMGALALARIDSIAASANGALLAVQGHGPRNVPQRQIWALAHPEERARAECSTGECCGLRLLEQTAAPRPFAFDPRSADYIVIDAQDLVIVRSPDERAPCAERPRRDRLEAQTEDLNIRGIAFSPDGTMLYYGGGLGKLYSREVRRDSAGRVEQLGTEHVYALSPAIPLEAIAGYRRGAIFGDIAGRFVRAWVPPVAGEDNGKRLGLLAPEAAQPARGIRVSPLAEPTFQSLAGHRMVSAVPLGEDRQWLLVTRTERGAGIAAIWEDDETSRRIAACKMLLPVLNDEETIVRQGCKQITGKEGGSP